MPKVKPKKKTGKLLAFFAFRRELLLIEKTIAPSESVSAYVRAAIRYFAEERLLRQ